MIFASDRSEREVIIVQAGDRQRRRVLPGPIPNGMTELEWLANPLLLEGSAAFTEEQEAAILAAHDQRQLTGEAAPILLKPYAMPQLAAPPEDEQEHEQDRAA